MNLDLGQFSQTYATRMARVGKGTEIELSRANGEEESVYEFV
jgi:hypothetical protein